MSTATHTIPTALLQEMVNYLQERPFKEVAGLLGRVMSESRPHVEEKEFGAKVLEAVEGVDKTDPQQPV